MDGLQILRYQFDIANVELREYSFFDLLFSRTMRILLLLFFILIFGKLSAIHKIYVFTPKNNTNVYAIAIYDTSDKKLLHLSMYKKNRLISFFNPSGRDSDSYYTYFYTQENINYFRRDFSINLLNKKFDHIFDLEYCSIISDKLRIICSVNGKTYNLDMNANIKSKDYIYVFINNMNLYNTYSENKRSIVGRHISGKCSSALLESAIINKWFGFSLHNVFDYGYFNSLVGAFMDLNEASLISGILKMDQEISNSELDKLIKNFEN